MECGQCIVSVKVRLSRRKKDSQSCWNLREGTRWVLTNHRPPFSLLSNHRRARSHLTTRWTLTAATPGVTPSSPTAATRTRRGSDTGKFLPTFFHFPKFACFSPKNTLYLGWRLSPLWCWTVRAAPPAPPPGPEGRCSQNQNRSRLATPCRLR